MSQFEFLDICVVLFLCINNYEIIYVKKTLLFLFYLLYFKAKSKELGGLVVCAYDGISVLKIFYFIELKSKNFSLCFVQRLITFFCLLLGKFKHNFAERN